jgi:hypothetical protein
MKSAHTKALSASRSPEPDDKNYELQIDEDPVT